MPLASHITSFQAATQQASAGLHNVVDAAHAVCIAPAASFPGIGRGTLGSRGASFCRAQCVGTGHSICRLTHSQANPALGRLLSPLRHRCAPLAYRRFESPLSALESQESCVVARSARPGFGAFGASSMAIRWSDDHALSCCPRLHRSRRSEDKHRTSGLRA